MEIQEELYKKIVDLSNLGESFFKKRNFDTSRMYYQKALELVPVPKNQWEAATWLYVAIGDAYFLEKEYEKALNNFYAAYNCPGAIDNPFINLRIGQCLYELKDLEKAENFLLKAYMLEGIDIFKSENKKYLKFLKEKYNL